MMRGAPTPPYRIILQVLLALGSFGLCGWSLPPTTALSRSLGNGSNGGNGGDMLALAYADVAWTVYRDLEARLAVETDAPNSSWEQLRAKMPQFYKELTERTIYSRPDLRNERGEAVAELWSANQKQYLPSDGSAGVTIPWSAVALSNWAKRGDGITDLVFAFKPAQAQGVGQIAVNLTHMTARVLIDKDLSDAVRTGAAFSAQCQWQGSGGLPAAATLVCTPDQTPGLVAAFKIPPAAAPNEQAAAVEGLRLSRQENDLLLNQASWQPQLMGTTRFTAITKRDVFTVYQKILGIVDKELPYRYQPFPRIGAAVEVPGGTRFLWQREDDPATFTRWSWTDDRPRHLGPHTPFLGTILAITQSDLGPILRLSPTAAVRSSGLWAVRRTNPVVGNHPVTGQPYRQLQDDWMWIFWTSTSALLPQYQTVSVQNGGTAPALQMPRDGTLDFFLEDVQPAP